MRRGVKPVHQLLLDMPVRWSSTYVMTIQAEEMHDVQDTMVALLPLY